jgi:hypothetical protein
MYFRFVVVGSLPRHCSRGFCLCEPGAWPVSPANVALLLLPRLPDLAKALRAHFHTEYRSVNEAARIALVSP